MGTGGGEAVRVLRPGGVFLTQWSRTAAPGRGTQRRFWLRCRRPEQ